MRGTWYDCPFGSEREALQFVAAVKSHGFTVESVPTAWSEGKARELDSARAAAVWPEATDDQLSVEPAELKVMLLSRLPALMDEFKAAVEALGFIY